MVAETGMPEVTPAERALGAAHDEGDGWTGYMSPELSQRCRTIQVRMFFHSYRIITGNIFNGD
jgi:hypothetical protein